MRTNHLLTTLALAALLVPVQASATKSMSLGNITCETMYENVYADADGYISSITYSVPVTNDGDETLVPGDENYAISLYDFSDDIVLQTVPIEVTIEPGETVTVDVDWNFSIAPIIEKRGMPEDKWRLEFEIQNPMNEAIVRTFDWRDVYPYSLLYQIKDTSNSDVTSLSFGFISEPVMKSIKIRATGSADVVVASTDIPEGYTVTPNIFTVAGNMHADATHEQLVNITLGVDVPGVLAGDIVFNLDNGEQIVIPVTGAVVDDETFFEGFELPTGVSLSGYVPNGWIFGERWSVASMTSSMSSDNDKYLVQHNSSNDGYESMIITPRLLVEDGQTFIFEAAKRNNDSKITVYVSSDRSNWTPVKTITTNASDPNDKFSMETAGSSYYDYKMKTFSLTGIPAGEIYLGFEGLYARINNCFGFKRAQVDHDFILTSSNVPASGVENNPYKVTLSAKNLLTTAEAAESYTVTLYVDNEAVATAETSLWEAGATNDFTLSFVPHKTGDLEVYAEIKAGNVAVATPISSVSFRAETLEGLIKVGTPSDAAIAAVSGRGKTPFDVYYKNTSSQTIYPADFLAQYGLTPGTKITGIRYAVGKCSTSSNKEYDAAAGVLMAEVEQSTITPSTAIDMTGLEPLNALTVGDDGRYVHNHHYSFVSGQSSYDAFSVDFKEPFVYEGGNLAVMPFTESTASGGWIGSTWFELSDELGADCNASVWRGNDTYSTYLSSGYTQATYIPVITFVIAKDPITISGTVTDSQSNEPVAGAEITLVSGDVIYRGVTAEDGTYSIDVFQSDLDYTITVEEPNYSVLTDEVSFAEGSVLRDFELNLEVAVNAPTNLSGKVDHDIFTGRNDILLTWDMEITDDFEQFVVTLNGVEVATTDQNDYILENVADGDHVVGVSARYAGAQSEAVTAEFCLTSDNYAKATFNVASNNNVIPEDLSVRLEGENGDYLIPVIEATAEAASLPKGSYVASVEAKHYDAWSQEIVLDADKAVDVNLVETLVAPFNLSVEEILNEETNEYDYVMSWNSTTGNEETTPDVGNVLSYNVKLNGNVVATVTEPTYTFSGLDEGQNTAAVSANYVSGTSAETTYLFDVMTGIDRVGAPTPFAAVTGLRGEISVKASQAADIVVTDMAGRTVAVSSIEEGEARIAVASGVYLVKVNNMVAKVVVR